MDFDDVICYGLHSNRVHLVFLHTLLYGKTHSATYGIVCLIMSFMVFYLWRKKHNFPYNQPGKVASSLGRGGDFWEVFQGCGNNIYTRFPGINLLQMAYFTGLHQKNLKLCFCPNF